MGFQSPLDNIDQEILVSLKAKKVDLPDEVIAHDDMLTREEIEKGWEGLPREEKVADKPKSTSPEWNDYVLSHLTEEEFAEDKNGKKHPTTDGLRRIADVLFHEVVITTKIIQAPNSQNGMVAACECSVSSNEQFNGYKSVTEVADASPENTDFPYSKFLTAIAGTRAEGRALRKYLRLRKVVTAEEVGSGAAPTTEGMKQNQAKMLATLGERFNLNIWKFVTDLLKKSEPNKVYNYLNEISYDFTVGTILPEIQKFQQKDKEGNIIKVPEELMGYQNNLLEERWKS